MGSQGVRTARLSCLILRQGRRDLPVLTLGLTLEAAASLTPLKVFRFRLGRRDSRICEGREILIRDQSDKELKAFTIIPVLDRKIIRTPLLLTKGTAIVCVTLNIMIFVHRLFDAHT